MTSDFAREFYDLIPPTLGPNVTSSRSFDLSDTANSSMKHDAESDFHSNHDANPPLIPSPTKTTLKSAFNISASSNSSASKKASAARQRYVGLASARSPLTSRSRFDLGLDSPGSPQQTQTHSRTQSYSAVASASSRSIAKHSSHDAGEGNLRARLVDLDSRLLQVCLTCVLHLYTSLKHFTCPRNAFFLL